MNKKVPQQLVLVRHARSRLNIAKIKSPVFFVTAEDRQPFLEMPDHKVDVPEEFYFQPIETGRALKEHGYQFDTAYDTGYERTVKTLDLMLEQYPENERLAIRRKSCISLRERECGYGYAMTAVEMNEHFPWLQAYWKTVGPIFARPIGGESLADVIDRTSNCLPTLFQETAGERVLMSLHGRVIAAIRFLLEGWTCEEFETFLSAGNTPKNCGVTVYNYSSTEKRFLLQEYNTCHWQAITAQ